MSSTHPNQVIHMSSIKIRAAILSHHGDIVCSGTIQFVPNGGILHVQDWSASRTVMAAKCTLLCEDAYATIELDSYTDSEVAFQFAKRGATAEDSLFGRKMPSDPGLMTPHKVGNSGNGMDLALEDLQPELTEEAA